MLLNTSLGYSHSNGVLPVKSSNAMQPNAHKSVPFPDWLNSSISGAEYKGVPTKVPRFLFLSGALNLPIVSFLKSDPNEPLLMSELVLSLSLTKPPAPNVKLLPLFRISGSIFLASPKSI